MNKAVFLDRDGVLNEERGTYTWRLEDFKICNGVPDSLQRLKSAGYFLLVVTNQAGISRGIYTIKDMIACHEFLRAETGGVIDHIYYAVCHPEFSRSLMRKPDSLMFEKGLAKYQIDPAISWMVGNSERDMIPAMKLNINTIFTGRGPKELPVNFYAEDLISATEYILRNPPGTNR